MISIENQAFQNCTSAVFSGWPDGHWRDFLGLPSVSSIAVGNECFENVGELKLIGLSELESVVVGERSFTKNSAGNDDSLKLCLKNCPKLRDLSIGSGSFSDYNVLEIENTGLEEMNLVQGAFSYASFQLRSVSVSAGMMARFVCSQVTFHWW